MTSYSNLRALKQSYENQDRILNELGDQEYEFLRPIFQNILTVLALYDMDSGIRTRECHEAMSHIADEFFRSVVNGPAAAQPFERLSTMRMNLIFGHDWNKAWKDKEPYESNTYMRSVEFNKFIDDYMESFGNLPSILETRLMERCGDGGGFGEAGALVTAILQGLEQICDQIGNREEDQWGLERVQNRNYRNQWRSENYIGYIIIVFGFVGAFHFYLQKGQALEDAAKQMPWLNIIKRLTPEQRRTFNSLTTTDRGTFRTIGQNVDFDPGVFEPGVGFTIVTPTSEGSWEAKSTWDRERGRSDIFGISSTAVGTRALPLGNDDSCPAIVQIPSPTALYLVKTAVELASFRLSAFQLGSYYYQAMTLGQLFKDNDELITKFIQKVVLQQVKLPMFKLACEDLSSFYDFDDSALRFDNFPGIVGAGLGAGTMAIGTTGILGFGVSTTSIASIAAGFLSSMHVDSLRSSLPSPPGFLSSPPPPPPSMTKIQKLHEVARIIDKVIDGSLSNLHEEAKDSCSWSVSQLEGWTRKAMNALRGTPDLDAFEKLLKQYAKCMRYSLQDREIRELAVWKQLADETEMKEINEKLPQLRHHVEEAPPPNGWINVFDEWMSFSWNYWMASPLARLMYHDSRFLGSLFSENSSTAQTVVLTLVVAVVAQKCWNRIWSGRRRGNGVR